MIRPLFFITLAVVVACPFFLSLALAVESLSRQPVEPLNKQMAEPLSRQPVESLNKQTAEPLSKQPTESSAKPSTPVTQDSASPDSKVAGSPQGPPEEVILPGEGGFLYDPTGKRDPFKSFFGDEVPRFDETGPQPPADTLEAYDVNQLKLVAVLTDVPVPKGMIRSPTGKTFLVKERSKIGRNRGYVATIRQSELVVVELSQDGKTPSTRVMSLQK